MKKIFISAFVFITIFFGLATGAYAMTPTLSVYSGTNNMVTINVSNADANAGVYLYYNSFNYSGTQNAYLGTTNYSGYFSTSVSGSQYNISSGSAVYVVVNGQQSQSYAWPSVTGSSYYPYTNNNAPLGVSSLTLPVGSSAVLNSYNSQPIYVSSNSNPNVVSTSNNNTYNYTTPVGCTGSTQYSPQTGQPCYNYNYNYSYNTYNINTSVQLNALAVGTSTISFCQTGGTNCSAVNVTVVGGVVSPVVYNTNTPQVLGACYFSTTLRRNMSGGDVECLQDVLVTKGYLTYGSYTRGFFDLRTWNAVVSFQSNRGLSADGIVGYMTRTALFGSY